MIGYDRGVSSLSVRLFVVAALLSACANDSAPKDAAPSGDAAALQPSDPQVLTPPTQGTHDEDPCLVRAHDGSFYLAWLSDRDGKDDIYVMRSPDGRGWETPVRVTTHPDPDFYPSLLQSSDGRFHLVWFRPMTASPFYRHVYANHSDDGLTWSLENEIAVTSGAADDWAPMMLQTAGGDLLVYFSSQVRGTSGTSDLYLSRSTDLGASWQPPMMLATVSDPAQMDLFPYVVERAAGYLAMVWVR